MSDNLKTCPQCECPYAYATQNTNYTCPDCAHTWDSKDIFEDDTLKVIDSNGNVLQTGDTVVVIKDLPVKGASKAIKAGTKVKNIKLTDGDHNIDCKIEGFGSMALKSEFVKKA